MINIVVPLAGPSPFFEDAEFNYPKPLIEISGKTMIQIFIDNIKEINKNRNFIFIVNESDCKKHHLDNVLNLLTNYKCSIIKLSEETKGAACSVLMAVEYINNIDELIIANPDQYIDIDYDKALISFKNADAGVLTFESIHPRWSYVRLDDNRHVVETAEKRPISKHAIAGFYYFKKGSDFVEGAMEMIKKDASINGHYFISPVMNELVLKNKTLMIHGIEEGKYHTFYSPQKIQEYERISKC